MGEIFSLLSAVFWGLAVIFFKRTGETVAPLALNLFRVAFSSAVFLLTLAVLQQPLLGVAPPRDYAILAVSGIIAIAISDTFFHMALNRVGAGIQAVVDCLYSPAVVLFGFLLLDERLGPGQFVGMGLVIAGVVVAAGHAPPPGTSGRTLAAGVAFGVIAMATLALGIVIAKPVLERSSVLWATAVRQLVSLVVLLALALLSPRHRFMLKALRPHRDWRFSVPGTLLGSYIALLCWIAGMKLTRAGTAAIFNQTSTIFIFVFAALLLREPFTRRKALAGVLALAGIVVTMAS
ncbi:MAG: DMT family transporter [Candidatus Krumholzibacteriia bacterium]